MAKTILSKVYAFRVSIGMTALLETLADEKGVLPGAFASQILLRYLRRVEARRLRESQNGGSR